MKKEMVFDSSSDQSTEAGSLLEWYDQHRRALPWRDTSDPYQILVSEVMLQQTQVTRVIPYFRSFLERFPTVEKLAVADCDAVEAAWSGLGYYRRARQLHAAAGRIVERGAFPRNAAQLVELPGIGPYTAAAVASIAFGEVVAVLDGNVERVVCRRLAFEGNPKTVKGRRRLLSAAAALLDPQRVGDSNQALMELGATTCRPIDPRCCACPLEAGCEAKRRGRPEAFPKRTRKRASVKVEKSLVVVKRGEKLLLFRRAPTEAVLAGQWEIPGCSGSSATSSDFGRVYGGEWMIGRQLGVVRHTITFRAMTVYVYGGEFEPDRRSTEDTSEWRWADTESLSNLAVSSLVMKVIERCGVFSDERPLQR